MRNRVVVTGLGILAANGIGLEAFWETLVAGKSGIGPVTLFDASGLSSRIAGEVKDFDPLDYIDAKIKPQKLARQSQLGVAAALMALKDAKLDASTLKLSAPLPIIIGTSSSAFDIFLNSADAILKRGAKSASPHLAFSASPQATASTISKILEVEARCLTFSTACAAGLDAIASAASLICSGKADIAVCGGADAPISVIPFANMDSAGLLSTRNSDPGKASRPFDRDRDGGVLSEGAGIVVLENFEHAMARGAIPYLEITGYGNAVDKFNPSASSGQVPSARSTRSTSSPLDVTRGALSGVERAGTASSSGATSDSLDSFDKLLSAQLEAHRAGFAPDRFLRFIRQAQDQDKSGQVNEPASGLEDSMKLALANAGLHPEKLDYVSTHGPSDTLIDRIESKMIKKVLGARAYQIAVGSIKGVTGNPLSAAGAMQLIAIALAVKFGLIPPTANYEKPDPECDLDYVPGEARQANLSHIMINSHGVGGGNSSLIVQRLELK